MDNIIYIILAAAVFIALAGILLFIAGDSLVDADSEADNLQDSEEYLPDSYTRNVQPSYENTKKVNSMTEFEESEVLVNG